jgi:phosphatidylethanolamine-binding protein (PEBP) family uncharacterized protein
MGCEVWHDDTVPHPRRHARGLTLTILTVAVVSASTLAGCGETSSTPTTAKASKPLPPPKPGSRRHLPTFVEGLASPAITPNKPISSRYTCDGANTPPPLHWTKAPLHTAEQILMIFDYKFIHDKPVVHWALARINPRTQELDPNNPPVGATFGNTVTGHTSYDICPEHNTTQEYAIALFSLPHKLNPKPNFNSITTRVTALHYATTEQLLTFTYTRH